MLVASSNSSTPLTTAQLTELTAPVHMVHGIKWHHPGEIPVLSFHSSLHLLLLLCTMTDMFKVQNKEHTNINLAKWGIQL